MVAGRFIVEPYGNISRNLKSSTSVSSTSAIRLTAITYEVYDGINRYHLCICISGVCDKNYGRRAVISCTNPQNAFACECS